MSTQTAYIKDYSNETQGPVCITRSYHDLREVFGFSRIVADVHELIDGLSNKPGHSHCTMLKVKIAELLRCSLRSVFYACNVGLKIGTLEQPEHDGRECRAIRTTALYRDQKAFEIGKLDSKNRAKNARFREKQEPPEKQNRAKNARSEGQNRAKTARHYKDKPDKHKNPDFSSLSEKAKETLLRVFGYIPNNINLENPHRILKAFKMYREGKNEQFQGLSAFMFFYKSIPDSYTPEVEKPVRSPGEHSETPVAVLNAEVDRALTEIRNNENIEVRDMAMRLEMERPLTADIDTLTQYRDKILRIYGQETTPGLRATFA